MRNKRYLLKLKPPSLSFQSIIAATAEIYGDHLALVNSEGKLAALFLLDVVQGWVEIDEEAATAAATAGH